MHDPMIYKKEVAEKLALIATEIAGYEIIDKDSSLFGFKHGLSAEMLCYILLEFEEVFGFGINDEFMDALQDYSFNGLVDAIISHLSRLEESCLS